MIIRIKKYRKIFYLYFETCKAIKKLAGKPRIIKANELAYG
jgi:hypothetical protein